RRATRRHANVVVIGRTAAELDALPRPSRDFDRGARHFGGSRLLSQSANSTCVVAASVSWGVPVLAAAIASGPRHHRARRSVHSPTVSASTPSKVADLHFHSTSCVLEPP